MVERESRSRLNAKARGGMIGAASGAVLLGVVQNHPDLGQVNNYWIEAIGGGVILAALFMDRVVGDGGTVQ